MKNLLLVSEDIELCEELTNLLLNSISDSLVNTKNFMELSFKNSNIAFFDLSDSQNNFSAIYNLQPDSILRNMIIAELEYLNFNVSYTGTNQLIDCILLCLRNPNYINNLSQTCYSILSPSSPSTIKSNIFRAIENSYFDCSEEIFKKYFDMIYIEKPTTKKVINSVCDHIKSKMTIT